MRIKVWFIKYVSLDSNEKRNRTTSKFWVRIQVCHLALNSVHGAGRPDGSMLCTFNVHQGEKIPTKAKSPQTLLQKANFPSLLQVYITTLP